MNQNLPETHESYGIVSFSRISAHPPVPLFGSSIRHSHIISLKVSTCKKYRDFQSDSFADDERLIEVFLSPSQFAEAITSFNVGCGVPCTISAVKGDKWDNETMSFRKPCPEVNFKKQATNELKKEMDELSNKVKTLQDNAEEILTRKGTLKAGDKKSLLSNIKNLIQEIKSNIPFANECFNRSIDKTVTEAKAEIDSTYQTLREKLGDKVLEGKIEIPQLDAPKEINVTDADINADML